MQSIFFNSLLLKRNIHFLKNKHRNISNNSKDKYFELPGEKDVLSHRSRMILYFVFASGLWSTAALAIFNYQRLNSRITIATLHAVRSSKKANEILGSSINFRKYSKWWWPIGTYVKGAIDFINGGIEICYDVTGSKGNGTIHFKSTRKRSNLGNRNMGYSFTGNEYKYCIAIIRTRF